MWKQVGMTLGLHHTLVMAVGERKSREQRASRSHLGPWPSNDVNWLVRHATLPALTRLAHEASMTAAIVDD